jgi:hypothetical protein
LLFVTDDDSNDEPNPEDLQLADPDPPLEPTIEEFNSAQLSFHALSGVQSAQTIRVVGRVGSQTVRVLVDGGVVPSISSKPKQPISCAFHIFLHRPLKSLWETEKSSPALKFARGCN